MSNEIYGYEAFHDLANVIEKYAESVDNAMDGIEAGAEEFTNDLLKLPKPMSKIRKAGYTHLVNTFANRRQKEEIEVGWGKYYGPIIERGSKNMDAYPHVYPLWDRNKEKYYKTMLTKLGIQTW